MTRRTLSTLRTLAPYFSVRRHTRIHILAPALDSARQVPHTLEAGGSQLPHGLRAATASLAVHDDLAIARQLVQSRIECCQRDVTRSSYPSDRPLVRIADIDDIERFPRSQPERQSQRLDLRNRAEHGIVRDRAES